MTHPWPTATPPDPAQDADRLGDAWDALVAGHRPTVAEQDAELMALAGQLSAEATQVRPTLTFRNHLREILMDTGTMPMTAAPTAPAFHPLPRLGRPLEIGHPAVSLPARIGRVGMRWAALAATIALLLATAGGGYLATRGLGDGGRATSVAGFQASPVASPETAGYVDECAALRPYQPCGGDGVIGRGLIAGYTFAPALLDVTLVTMQGWEIPAGNTITYEPDPNRLSGVAVDFVLEGAYVATFSGPVIVQRHDVLGSSVEYPVVGEVVELGYGDTVSYELATRVSITNPLSTRPLRFKSVVFHEEPSADTGAPGSGQPIEGNPGGGDVRITDDGTGQLPKPISQYPNRELNLFLMYVQVYPEAPFPPSTGGGDSLVLGPVDPVQPEIEEGYIVWAFESRG